MVNLKFNIKRAVKAQEKLAEKISTLDLLEYPPKLLLGLDVSYAGNFGVAASTIYSYPNLEFKGVIYKVERVEFPYIPGLLAYRELPLYVRLLRDFRRRRDVVLIVDGHGIAHPRRLGIASHLGLVLDVPSIGVAKKILVGKLVNEKVVFRGETVALQVKSGKNKKPVYVSPGHLVSLETAVEIVKSTIKNWIPEPIRRAHTTSKSIARGVKFGLEKT